MSNLFNDAKSRILNLPFIRSLTLPLALGLLASIICLVIFAAIAEDLHEPGEEIIFIDIAFAQAFRADSPQALTFYRALSFIGYQGLWIIGVLVALYFVIKKHWLHLGLWVVTLLGGLLLNNVLKLLFARPRPETRLIDVIAYSFPSGHAMMSLIGFGLLTYFLWRATNNAILRIFLVFGSTLLVMLVGISRLALNVHYVSDVLAGFAAGGVWLLSCIIVANRIARVE
ncbi:MAG: phosphatase PAP2 family protein [Anaerolineae bacterium]|nr:phosphatase PAP2 family protein [Anaerolineae bacterium]